MAKTEKSPKSKRKGKQPAPNQNQQAIEDLSWDVPFSRTVWNYFVLEGEAVKNGWLAVIILCGISVWITHSCTKDALNDKITENDRTYSVAAATNQAVINNLQAQNDKLIQVHNDDLQKMSDLRTEFFRRTTNSLADLLGYKEETNFFNITNSTSLTNFTEVVASYQILNIEQMATLQSLMKVAHQAAPQFKFYFLVRTNDNMSFELSREIGLVGQESGIETTGMNFVDEKQISPFIVILTKSKINEPLNEAFSKFFTYIHQPPTYVVLPQLPDDLVVINISRK